MTDAAQLVERFKQRVRQGGPLVWACAYAAVLALFAAFYLPLSQRLGAVESALASRGGQIRQIRASGLDGIDPKRLVAMQQRAQRFEKGFIAPDKAAQVIDRISDLARKHSVKIVEIHSEAVVDVQEEKGKRFEYEGTVLRRLPIQMKLSAPFPSLAEFVRSLEEATGRVLVVDEYRIETGAAGRVSCDVTVSFFLK